MAINPFKVPSCLDYITFEKSFLTELNYKKYKNSKQDIVIDASETTWADLMEVIALLVAAQKFQATCRATVSFAFGPPDDSNPARSAFLRFLQAWRFPSFLREKGFAVDLVQMDIPATEKFLPLTNLAETSVGNIAARVRNTLSIHFPWLQSEQVYSFVEAMMGEVCENAIIHPYGDGVPPSLRCQVIAIRRIKASQRFHVTPYWFRRLKNEFPGEDFLEITIVDGGFGIMSLLRGPYEQSLRNRLAATSDRALLTSEVTELGCLRFALSRFRSSHLPEQRRGFGLYRCVQHAVTGWGGLFYLRSGCSRIVELPNQLPEEIGTLSNFPGTQVRLFLPVVDRRREIDIVLKEVDVKLGVST